MQETRNDQSVVTTTSRSGPGGVEVIQRILVLVFGLIQLLIGARIVLLLLDARTTNDLVSNILNASNVFVTPFNGILQTNSLTSSGSVLDLSAILAFVAVSVVEIVVFWGLNIFSRERTTV